MNRNNYLGTAAGGGAGASQLPARSMRQQSLAGVQAALVHSLRINKSVADPAHPDLLSADRALASAATQLATLPNVLPYARD